MPSTRPLIRSALFDLLVVAGVAGLASLGIALPASWATVWLGFGMAAALAVRRRWPLAVMAAVASLALLQVILFPPRYDPLPYDVAVLIAMFSVVKYGRRMRDSFLAAAVVATGITIEVVRHVGPSWWALALWYVAVCSGVWLAGYTVRTRRAYVVGLEERAATLEREREHLARIAVADERAVIARELHDVVAHSLAVMIVQADGGRYAFEAAPEKARETLETVAATGREALEDMRRLVDVLRGSEIGGGGTGPDLRWVGMEQLEALAERARTAGLAVSLDWTGERDALPRAVELTAFRLVQEALTNVLRHAGPQTVVVVTITRERGELRISIVDDGGRHPGRGAPSTSGHGLVGMRERVAVHGGVFAAGPLRAGGWSVTASIPLRSQRSGESGTATQPRPFAEPAHSDGPPR